MMIQKDSPENDLYSIVIEGDKRVVYAYLLRSEKIVGDVWLYNKVPAPLEREWKAGEQSKMPFLNSLEYVFDGPFVPINDGNEVDTMWKFVDDRLERVEIFFRGEKIAILKEGAKPGWSKMAKKDGPLAKVLWNSDPQ